MHFFGSIINLSTLVGSIVWEPAGAMALSIFLTVTLFLTVYGLSYWGIKLFLKGLSSIKKQIKNVREE